MVDTLRNLGRRPALRAALVAAALGLGLVKFTTVVHQHYPIQHWLFWRYAKVGGLTVVWTLACLLAGHALLRALLRRVMPLLEQLVLSFAVGVFAFFLLVFLGGLLHLYGPAFFFALPVLMLGAGAWFSRRQVVRLMRHLRAARSKHTIPARWWSVPLLLYGSFSTLAIYLLVLLPDNAAYDAYWYHLPIAEHYAAAGGVVPFKEGWYLGAYPHLASILFAWAMQQPFSKLFDRVELCAHIEFVLFLWTLASVPLLVRRLLPRTRASWSWTAVFLFPGIMLYDSSLSVAADHIAAFWAIPIYVALLRAWPGLDWRWCSLLAVFIAAALDTKYSSVTLFVAPVAAVCARAVFLLVQTLRRRTPGPGPNASWKGLAVCAVTGIVMTAPHWAKNWVFYGDPIYPILWRHLPVHPWTPDSGPRYDLAVGWHPTRDLAGLWETTKVLWTFSFVPNDWEQFHGTVPVFGSLFTLTLLALPFLRRTARLWGLVIATHVGVFVWYSIHHQDRYLQTLLPWMAASTAAVLVLAWRSGWLARVAIVPLVLMQVIWGLDVYFIPTHANLKTAPIKVLADLAAAGFKREYLQRFDRFGQYANMAHDLARSDVVLVHEDLQHVGLRARSISDYPRYQGGISYGRLRSPREVWDKLRELGVTHLIWHGSHAADSYAGDLVFWDFALRHTGDFKHHGTFTLAAMPAAPPDDRRFGDVVAVFTCRKEYRGGLYHLPDLTVYPLDTNPVGGYPTPFEPIGTDDQIAAQILRADFLIYDSSCRPKLDAAVSAEFQPLVRRGGPGNEWLYVRKTSP